ncbi:MAG: insulinase family protein [Lactobacillales bacterium]|nr:insulinase family protein [Lactobacillales bacterium]
MTESVHLLMIPTKKYKTVKIVLRFSAPLEEGTRASRSLLSNVMETNSKKFPLQTDISRYLAELYGADFQSYVDRKGDIHRVNFVLTIVNDSYVENKNLLEEAVGFLKEIIFHPNIKDGSFNSETFQLEQDNLIQSIESLADDKGFYAKMRLQELYYKSSKAQGGTNFGTVDEVRELDPKKLAAAYHEMMLTNSVDILVMGDIKKKRVQELFASFPFVARESLKTQIFYDEPYTNVIEERTELEELAQSKLCLAYHLPIKFSDPSYFPLQVFNGLFGGFPHSKLFMNVREKESLAYYASSSFDSFRSFLMVTVGIDGKNREKVLKLIQTQLLSIAVGKFTRLEFFQTKRMLKNLYLEALDSMDVVIEYEFMNALLPNANFTKQEWLKLLEQVSEEEVMEVAKEIKLQAVFFLGET